MGVADAEFKRALALCPRDPGALTGAGYAAMRRARLAEARNFFLLPGDIIFVPERIL